MTLDVGTNNEAFLNDPLYLGLERRRRANGPAYDALVEEFISAVADAFPTPWVQLEDFGNCNAFQPAGAIPTRPACLTTTSRAPARWPLAACWRAADQRR